MSNYILLDEKMTKPKPHNRKFLMPILVALTLIIAIFVSLPTFATSDTKTRLLDEANEFKGSQKSVLSEELDKFSEEYKCDFIIFTSNKSVDDLNSYIADRIIEQDFQENWILFIMDFWEREINIVLSESMMDYITEEEVEAYVEDLVGEMQYGVDKASVRFLSLMSENLDSNADYIYDMELDKTAKDRPSKTADVKTVHRVSNAEKVVDITGTLKPEEIAEIKKVYAKFSEKNKCDIVFAIINDNTSGLSSEEYAKKFYDLNKYGVGKNNDGALMLIDLTINEPGKRRIEIVRAGFAKPVIDRFNEQILDYVFDDVKAQKYGKVALGFELELQKSLIKLQVSDGRGVGLSYNEIFRAKEPFYLTVVSKALDLGTLVVSLMVTLVIMGIISAQHKSTGGLHYTKYEVNNSFKINSQKDLFKYKSLSKTVRVRESSSDSSSSDSGSSSSGGWSSDGGSSGGGGRSF